jgi:uncharacterized protein YqeY
MAGASPPELRDVLRAALAPAIRDRDTITVAALRSALAAIENAEAVESAPHRSPNPSPIAGSVSGLGASETKRRTVTEDEAVRLVQQEIAALESAADLYQRAGRDEHAQQLRAQAAVLSRFVEAER